MIDLKALIQDVQQRSDEMRVQLNLAGKEAEQEWNILASEWHNFMFV